MNYNKEHFIKRFAEELELLKKNRIIKSEDAFAELMASESEQRAAEERMQGRPALNPCLGYDRYTIRNFRVGRKKPQDADIDIFTKLFGVRREYLLGADDHRTQKDYELWKAKEQFSNELREKRTNYIHKILVSLGYADGLMEKNDFSPSFPEKYKKVIQNACRMYRENSSDNGSSQYMFPLFNVADGTCINVDIDEYNAVLEDIFDFVSFRLQKLFDKGDLQKIENAYNLPAKPVSDCTKDETRENTDYIPAIEYFSDTIPISIIIDQYLSAKLPAGSYWLTDCSENRLFIMRDDDDDELSATEVGLIDIDADSISINVYVDER